MTVNAGIREEISIRVILAAIASTEMIVRAYDTKAQISLAATTIIALPVYHFGAPAFPLDRNPNLYTGFLIGYLVLVLLYLRVLLPVFDPLASKVSGRTRIYFIGDPKIITEQEYLRGFRECELLPSLTFEMFSLSEIRNRKHRRLKHATVATVFSIMIIVCAMLYSVRNNIVSVVWAFFR